MKVIIVLGNKLLPSGNISKLLINRLENAIKNYKKNDIFLVSGGNTAKVKHTEAYMMKKYILERLPNSNIITEAKSLSTKENIKNIKHILKKHNYNILLITSKSHLNKVKKLTHNLNWELKGC